MLVAHLISFVLALICITDGRAEENLFTKRENVPVCMKKEHIVYPQDPWDVQSCINTCKLKKMCQAYRLPDVNKETRCELYFPHEGSQDSTKANCDERDTIYVRNHMQHVGNLFTKRENSLVCLKMKFIAYPNDPWDAKSCINTCKDNNQCQAFKLPDWMMETKCELYVFTKCSEDINRADCSNRDTIYVRNQRGLPPGQLCPASFGYMFGSSKYLLQKLDNASWHKGAEFCDSQPGLSKYAEFSSAEETAYIDTFRRGIPGLRQIFIGGYLPESVDWPSGSSNDENYLKELGWQWLSCKTAVKPDLWAPSTPYNNNKYRYMVIWFGNGYGNCYPYDYNTLIDKILCECIDPF